MSESLWRLAWVVLLLAGNALPVVVQAAPVAPAEAEREMVALSNTFRAGHDLPALRPQPDLMRAASAFADYMAKTDRYGHTADGRQPDERALAARYAHCMVAENIAWQYNSDGFTSAALAKSFVEGWIASPPHRRNLLLHEPTDIAIAVAQSAGSGRWYAVQMLARPKALQIRFELSNQSAQTVRYTVEGREFPLPPRVTRWHETCGSQPLEVRLPDGAQPLVVQPSSGARYRIEAPAGRRELRLVGG